jgi:hypothetical protein
MGDSFPKVARTIYAGLARPGPAGVDSLAMQALTFWKTVAMDEANLLERLVAMLADEEVRYCVIGGQAVNA